MSDVNDATPFLVTWSLFRALEAADDLPDPVVDDLYENAIEQIGGDGLDSGWALVAARLRQALQDHAERVGCNCGSLEWLEAEQLRQAGQELDE
jgi:hypothetical protein